MPFDTTHRIHLCDAADMRAVAPGSVALIVTSPPYPMIAMWDESFSEQSPEVRKALDLEDGDGAFEAMHRVLDPVWQELARVLAAGGIACINIGDAVRTIAGRFALYSNHSRIIAAFRALGFQCLPAILWRKPTNAPNKFMGSGMYPPGAYVTLEHEYVLVFRKGDKREFARPVDKENRRRSAYFWEERNAWFSDVWFDLLGTGQQLGEKAVRNRSGAFPFELPYRLIQMFSVTGDTVLDPFTGTGTTLYAAMAAGRHSIGFERETGLGHPFEVPTNDIVHLGNRRIDRRLEAHEAFIQNRLANGYRFKYTNSYYDFPVMTRQETDLVLERPEDIRRIDPGTVEVRHAPERPESLSRTQAIQQSLFGK